jgi:hypothetical protein
MKTMVQASKGEALQVCGRTEQRIITTNINRDKSKTDRGRSSPRDETRSSTCILGTIIIILTIVGSWKTRRKENGTYQLKNKSDGDGKATIVSSDNSGGEFLAIFAACVSCDDEWILDTTASFHICCNRDQFSSYEFVQTGDFVHVGDDTPYHLVGVGSVQRRTHDWMTHTLTGVKQIPTMARNFLLLSTLDCKRYKYKGGNKVL